MEEEILRLIEGIRMILSKDNKKFVILNDNPKKALEFYTFPSLNALMKENRVRSIFFLDDFLDSEIVELACAPNDFYPNLSSYSRDLFKIKRQEDWKYIVESAYH